MTGSLDISSFIMKSGTSHSVMINGGGEDTFIEVVKVEGHD